MINRGIPLRRSAGLRKALCAALAAILLCFSGGARAPQAPPGRPAAAAAAQEQRSAGRKKAGLILGLTVAGVGGMWAALYRRGK